MSKSITSIIMPRTTLNISRPVLDELKRLGKQEGASLGTLASDLLAEALAQRASPEASSRFQWISQAMAPKVDLADKEALYRAFQEASSEAVE